MREKKIFQSICIGLLGCCLFFGALLQAPPTERQRQVNALIEQRAAAIRLDDAQLVANIDEQLADLGLEDLSTEDVSGVFVDGESGWIVCRMIQKMSFGRHSSRS